MLSLLLMLVGCEPDLATDHAGEPGMVGAVSEQGAARAWAIRDTHGQSTRIEASVDGGPPFVVVPARHNPDRVVVSPDGRFVAWVDGSTGIASVYVAPLQPDAPPTQITNVGLERVPRVPGQAPDGFVPPPWDDSLAFDGDFLTWDAPDGAHREAWR